MTTVTEIRHLKCYISIDSTGKETFNDFDFHHLFTEEDINNFEHPLLALKEVVPLGVLHVKEPSAAIPIINNSGGMITCIDNHLSHSESSSIYSLLSGRGGFYSNSVPSGKTTKDKRVKINILEVLFINEPISIIP